MNYYEDLHKLRAASAVRVGWRHELEQAYRFELVAELAAANDSILDVGCGLGGLAAYGSALGRQWAWEGIEPHAAYAAEAERFGPVTACRFETVQHDQTFDWCVAIGTLAGSDATLPDLASFASRSAQHLCIVFLRPDADRAWPDPAVQPPPEVDVALAERALREAGWSTQRISISVTDEALLGSRTTLPPMRSVAERFNATIDGPWGRASAARNAWLAAELGLEQEAALWLGEAAPGDLTELVRERLAAYGA